MVHGFKDIYIYICIHSCGLHTLLSDIVWIPAFIPALLHVKKLVSVWSHFSLSHLLISLEISSNKIVRSKLLPPPPPYFCHALISSHPRFLCDFLKELLSNTSRIYSRCGCPPSQEQPSTTDGVWNTAAKSRGTTPTSSGTPSLSSSHSLTFAPREGSPIALYLQ